MKSKLLLFFFLPFICFSQTQLGKNLTNPDENRIKPSEFGTGISSSADGTIIAVGAPGNNENSFVRVFKYQNNEWQQLGTDIVNESVLEKIGSSVSLSSDGMIVAIGAVAGGDLDEGLVRFYEFKDNSWQKFENEIVGAGTQHQIGYKVVMTPDAKFVAVSTIQNSGNKGYVKVYKNVSGVWTQKGAILEGEFNGDSFGITLDLSDDGNTLAVGNKGRKKAHIYKFENNDWSQIGGAFINLNIGNRQGLSVSLSSDGNRVAIGATGVSIYENNSGTWNLVGNLINYGSFSSISSDGNKIAIGDPYYSKVRNYIFENNSWNQRGNEIETWRNSRLGSKIVLSSDGENVFAFPVIYTFKSTLSVEEEQLNSFTKVYPNPVINSFTISFSDDNVLKKAVIYNLQGRKLIESNKKEISITNLSAGIYFLEIETNKGKITKKLIKK